MSITRLNTDTYSLSIGSHLRKAETGLSKAVSRLSTGLRIITGADDPSGIALASKFKSSISGTNIAIENAQNAFNLAAVAETGLVETTGILGRMRDIVVRGSNAAVLTTSDVQRFDTEFQQLKNELNRRTKSVMFNTKSLFDGTYSQVVIQVGPDKKDTLIISFAFPPNTLTLIAVMPLSLTSANACRSIIDIVQSALNIVAHTQAAIGSQEIKLQHVINDLSAKAIGLAAAQSRITDVDMAAEINNYTRLQVVAQSATAILAQANMQTQAAISLLEPIRQIPAAKNISTNKPAAQKM